MNNQELIKNARETASRAAYRILFEGFTSYEQIDRARNVARAEFREVARALAEFGYVEDHADRREYAALKRALDDLTKTIALYDEAAAQGFKPA